MDVVPDSTHYSQELPKVINIILDIWEQRNAEITYFHPRGIEKYSCNLERTAMPLESFPLSSKELPRSGSWGVSLWDKTLGDYADLGPQAPHLSIWRPLVLSEESETTMPHPLPMLFMPCLLYTHLCVLLDFVLTALFKYGIDFEGIYPPYYLPPLPLSVSLLPFPCHSPTFIYAYVLFYIAPQILRFTSGTKHMLFAFLSLVCLIGYDNLKLHPIPSKQNNFLVFFLWLNKFHFLHPFICWQIPWLIL